ncbi:hypothetical protein HNR60_003512 [Rhodopseudomonas rhenobacensis]|uniref:Uncharacterized protein n=1 Tax=Rhodopseudomonas rhenobacensis TaxID=87461 RepID=A0A7W7Z660_9BRAD|nr:hypothetical protein [Rhodopseudomonas rhenobacensis]MBB5048742.1 hypothetical protein [Rhodopseudomonas rhenobacensis]
MATEIGCSLTPDHWHTLRALRLPAAERRAMNTHALAELISLGLAAPGDDGPRITPTGRSVLLRGSPSLWDLAA